MPACSCGGGSPTLPYRRTKEAVGRTSAGIRCAMQRTPRWMEEQGCGYCLRLRQRELERARELLMKNGVQFRRCYRVDERGELVEVL